eukprot:scaffold120130_cov54-Phaeocystis_antarctica.AAC.4
MPSLHEGTGETHVTVQILTSDRQADRQCGRKTHRQRAARLLRDSSTATQACAFTAAPYGPPNEAPRAPTTSPTIFSTP